MTSLVFSFVMNLVVVGLLIGLWAWVLLPGLLRERRNASPLDTVNQFERSMDTLAQTGMEQLSSEVSGRHVLVLEDAERVVSGGARSRAELRRRAILARGGFVVAAAGIAGVVGGGLWWIPLGVVGVPYLLYVAAAVRVERRLAQQREMLHDLAQERERRQPPEPVPLETSAVELVVGDESGIIITGWNEPQSPRP
jgi:Flp pilus assembly protein TadB